MADVLSFVLAQAGENVKENATNGTGKPTSTPQGMVMAYGSLVIMSLLPIFFGSYRSVNYHKEKVLILEQSEMLNVKWSDIIVCVLQLFFDLRTSFLCLAETRENVEKRRSNVSHNGFSCIGGLVYSIQVVFQRVH